MSNEGISARSPEALQQIQSEIVSLAEGPIDLKLGSGSQAQHLQIVDPMRDLGPRSSRLVNVEIGCFVIDPAIFGPRAGYKALRDGESITLGRAGNYDSHRFHFSDTVSRTHVRLFRDEDEIYITDLDSTNGTYLIKKEGDDTTQSDAETVADATPPIEVPVGERPNSYRMAGKSVPRYESKVNEDTFFIDDEHRMVAVFDGMGGHAGSEEASALAAESVQQYLRQIPASTARGLAEQAIREALEGAHQIINERNAELEREASLAGNIGTTAIVAKIFETESGTPYAMVGSAGDSRAYLFRRGQIEHVTLDHAFLGLSTGERRNIQDTLSQAIDLSQLSEREYAMFYRRAVIDSCLGAGENNTTPTISLTTFELQAGDQLLLTSDGVHDNLTNAEIEETVTSGGDNPEAIVNALIHAAKERSRDESHLRHKEDDTTAVVLSCQA